MRLSIHQPAYLPWLGYLDKIQSVDLFVFLDSVQFEKNSYVNRNQIKTSQGPLWLSIPVKTKNHLHTSIANIQIDETKNWRKKHLKTIEQSYSKAPYFKQRFPRLEQLFEDLKPITGLADFCWQELQFWLNEFRISTEIIRASSKAYEGEKSDLILNICKHHNADTYLSGKFGKDYLALSEFRDLGIKVEFQEFQSPNYSQLFGDFVPNLSLIDFWFNVQDCREGVKN